MLNQQALDPRMILPASVGTGHTSVREEPPEARHVVQRVWGKKGGRWGLESMRHLFPITLDIEC